LFKKAVLILALVILVITGLGVDLNYWSLQAPYGTGATSKGSLSVYTNPAALILQRKWEANFLSTIWEDSEGNAYRIFGTNIIQPLENGFAGALDVLYGSLTDPENDDRYASFGYTVAGKVNEVGWGARILAGRFDKKDDKDAFYGSANFGLLYSVGESTHLMINANAPQIVTSDATVFEKNRPESFWAGGGLLSATDDARGYFSVQGYTKESKPLLSTNIGGGFKAGFFNMDLSLSVLGLNQQFDPLQFESYGNGLVLLDFENFAIGASASIPLHGASISSTKYSLFVSARW
jgi:hypothetical protein